MHTFVTVGCGRERSLSETKCKNGVWNKYERDREIVIVWVKGRIVMLTMVKPILKYNITNSKVTRYSAASALFNGVQFAQGILFPIANTIGMVWHLNMKSGRLCIHKLRLCGNVYLLIMLRTCRQIYHLVHSTIILLNMFWCLQIDCANG